MSEHAVVDAEVADVAGRVGIPIVQPGADRQRLGGIGTDAAHVGARVVERAVQIELDSFTGSVEGDRELMPDPVAG